MRKAAARLSSINLSTVGVTRLLVVSYFIGLALGLIQGVEVELLLRPFASEGAANILSAALLIGLSCMILTGFYRRPAALVLALVVFWASYLTMVRHAGPDQVGAFWRDLALIGALLMTYGQNAAGSGGSLPSPANSTTQPGDPDSIGDVFPNSPYTGANEEVALGRPNPRKRVRTEIYRQDLEVIRTS